MKAGNAGTLSRTVHGSKVDRIYRILLSTRRMQVSSYRIAKLADVSYGWAHNVLKGLEDEGVLKGTRVIDPRRMFELWMSRPDRRVYREYHLQDPRKALKGVRMEHAMSGHFAENLVNGYLFPRYHDVYIRKEDSSAWNEFLTEHGYVGRGNVRLFIDDEHVFFECGRVKGWPVVSMQQLIVDLLREGAECAEAADQMIGRLYCD